MDKREIKIPQADRLVRIPKESRDNLDAVEREVREIYRTMGVDKIRDLELEKTERDLQIINFVQDAISNLLKQYGREASSMPLNKIHILKDGGAEEYTGGKVLTGAHSAKLGSILIDRKKSDAEFAVILFHELLHYGSYKALQFVAGENPELEAYRSGFAVTSADGKTKYFEQVEEALVQIMVKRFYQEKVLHNELFKVDEPVLKFSREKELERLDYLIDELFKRNTSKFKSRQEIEELFMEGQINGRLLPVARLIEKTFGKGSFRIIGEKTVYK